MMEAAQTPHATPMAHATTDPRNYTRVLGLTAGMFSLLHVLIAGSAAVSARPAIITLQRSLIDYAQGGGVSIDQLSDPLLRLFVVTYLSALISMLITLGFCWYAGRVAKENTGEARAAGRAGATVALISGVVWFIVGIPAILFIHADGTVSWLVATVGVILAAPKAPPLSAVYMTSPGGQFLLIQFAALLLQLIPCLLIVLGLGWVAGRIGGAGINVSK
jgi:type IV secretory pathway TrbD component